MTTNIDGQNHLNLAVQYEKRGQNKRAALIYQDAFIDISDESDQYIDQRIEAKKQAGINYRLSGDRKNAHCLLDQAYRLALIHGKIHIAYIIRRDKAMLLINEEAMDDAKSFLDASYESQIQYGESVEAAATAGFIARWYFLKGDVYTARTYGFVAHQGLQGQHPAYELDNLIWRMKMSGLRERFSIFLRVVWLVKKTGYKRRAVEAIILLIGGNRLYQFARKRFA